MVNTQLNIFVTKSAQSKISNVDFSNIPFGRVFTDHMFMATYQDGKWGDCQILPYGNISISPASTVLHYGQSIFEGMKAYKNHQDGQIYLFRPDKNFERLNKSAARMCIPEIPADVFYTALEKLIALDVDWVPNDPSSSLYIRPVVFGVDDFIGVRASQKYHFLILLGPTNQYYAKPVRVKLETNYTRAAQGGTGAAKAAGNYAASLFPARQGNLEGYDQLLWTDAKEHKFIEESGTMNVMFVINGIIRTAPIGDTILDGVTRNSVLTLAKELNYTVEERSVSVDELLSGIKDGSVSEAFGVGTAATIAHIKTIGYQGHDYELPEVDNRPVASSIHDAIEQIRRGLVADRHNWMRKISI